MQSKNIWNYIGLGTDFRYLQEARKDRLVHGESYIIGNIERFLNKLEPMGFKVTARASYELEQLLEELQKTDEKAMLSAEQASLLSKIMNEIRPTFSAEGSGIYSYIVTDKRLSTDKLTTEIETLFAPDVFSKLSDIAQYDFKEAGYCVLFERPTAVAFHLMRVVESVLHIYYKKYIRPAQPNLTWGQMTNPLKNKSRGKKPNITTLNQLDHLRKAFRNPTQHPEKIYDIYEAQDLLFLSIDVINRMTLEIHN